MHKRLQRSMGWLKDLSRVLWKAVMEDRPAPRRSPRPAPKTEIPSEPWELTPDQRALLPVWRDRWLKIGLSTEPIDRSRAEAAIQKAYAPLKPPESLFICDSPMSAGLVTLALQGKPIAGLSEALGESVWASAQASLRQDQRRDPGKCVGGAWGAFSYPLLLLVSNALLGDDGGGWTTIRDPRWTKSANGQLDGKSLRNLLNLTDDREFGETLTGVKELGNVWSAVTKLDKVVTEAFSEVIAQGMRSYLTAQPRLERLFSEFLLLQGNRDLLLKPGTSVWELRQAASGTSWRALLDSSTDLHRWGMDTPWLPDCDYLWRVIGLETPGNLAGLIDLAQCCGWWAPYENVAILQHRPCEIHFDENGDLHNSNEMAVKFRDGWGVHCIHGEPTPTPSGRGRN